MWYQTLVLILSLAAANIASSSYHLHGAVVRVPKIIILNSYDPYSPITNAVRTELRLNNIKLLDDSKDKNATPLLLSIMNSSESQITKSIFQDGKTAEYQITLTVHAQIFIYGKDYYPINVKVCRSFFDNPLTALAKDSEGDIIRQELRQQAAQYLIRKLLAVYTAKESGNTLEAKLKQQNTAVDN